MEIFKGVRNIVSEYRLLRKAEWIDHPSKALNIIRAQGFEAYEQQAEDLNNLGNKVGRAEIMLAVGIAVLGIVSRKRPITELSLLAAGLIVADSFRDTTPSLAHYDTLQTMRYRYPNKTIS